MTETLLQRFRPADARRRFLWRYLAASAGLHLVWEIAHRPLYDWQGGVPSWRVELFPAVCTFGDVAIALFALALSIRLFGTPRQSPRLLGAVGFSTVAVGLAVTIVLEVVNVRLLETWSYRAAMPVEPVLGLGLSPLAQWIVVPTISLWWAGAFVRRR